MTRMTSLILAFGIAASGFFISNGIIGFKKMERSVEVRGLAEKTVDADLALWTINFSVSGDQLSELNNRILGQQNSVMTYLKAQGLKDEEIFKRPTSVHDRTTQEYGSSSKGPRYIAKGSVAVRSGRVKEVTAINANTDALIKQGITLTNNEVEYYFIDLNSVKPSMLEEATLNARAAAESFAKNAGAKVGPIRKAYQGLFSIGSLFADYDNRNSLQKKVRVVVTIDFNLE